MTRQVVVRLFVFCGLVVAAFTVRGGSFHFGETRYFPTEYSEPEVESGTGTRGRTYKPSIPKSFEKRDLGVGGGQTRVRVTGREGDAMPRSSVKIRLHDSGRIINVEQGEVFEAKGKKYRLVNVWKERIQVQRLDTGEIVTINRPRRKMR